jgi:hypothetical protein
MPLPLLTPLPLRLPTLLLPLLRMPPLLRPLTPLLRLPMAPLLRPLTPLPRLPPRRKPRSSNRLAIIASSHQAQ